MRDRKSCNNNYKNYIKPDSLYEPILENRSRRARSYRSRMLQLSKSRKRKRLTQKWLQRTKEISHRTPKQTKTPLWLKTLKYGTIKGEHAKQMAPLQSVSKPTEKLDHQANLQLEHDSTSKTNSKLQEKLSSLKSEFKLEEQTNVFGSEEKPTIPKSNVSITSSTKSISSQKNEKTSSPTISPKVEKKFPKSSPKSEKDKSSKSLSKDKNELMQQTNKTDAILKEKGDGHENQTTTIPPLTSTTTSKPVKHIHPCICDLTPSQIAKIKTHETYRNAIKRTLYRRINEIRQHYTQKDSDLEIKIQQEQEQMEDAKQMVEEVEEKLMREQVEKVKIVKKKPKRPPHVKKKIKKLVLRKVRRKQIPPKPRKVLVGMLLKIDFRKPPKFPVKNTRTFILRKENPNYCAKFDGKLPPHHKYPKRKPKKKLLPINYKDTPSVPIKQNRAAEVRLLALKNKKVTTSPVYKFDRPPFETCLKSIRCTKRKTTETKDTTTKSIK